MDIVREILNHNPCLIQVTSNTDLGHAESMPLQEESTGEVLGQLAQVASSGTENGNQPENGEKESGSKTFWARFFNQ